MRDFFQQSDKIYFDEAPCQEFSPATMIDNDFLPLFKAEAHISAIVPDEQLFSNLKLFSTNQTFKNCAVLFFGKNPKNIIDKAILRCIAFQGTDKRYIIDNKVYGGNLHQQ